MGPALSGRPHSSTLPPSPGCVTDPTTPIPINAAARPARPRTKPVGGGGASIPQRSPNHSRFLAPSRRRLCTGRRMAHRCAACKAWLRCPWVEAGSRSHNAAPITLDSWLPRGVGFVPGAAWPARPLDARATSYARRVVSKPGQAQQALRRPTQGRRLLSTVQWFSPTYLAQRPYT